MMLYFYYIHNVGFLTKWQMHIRARVSGTNLCANLNCWYHLFPIKTGFEG